MSLVKWEPIRELARLQDEMDRLFGQTLGQRRGETVATVWPGMGELWSPSVDVREENGNLVIEADLPGVKSEDVEITADQQAITIEGRTQGESEEKKEGYYRRERHSGHFMRTIPLPAPVDADKAKATFTDGTITVTLPKISAGPQGKKIKVLPGEKGASTQPVKANNKKG